MFSDSRLSVDTSVEPIELEGEAREKATKLREYTEQLGQLRAELGRLTQVINNALGTTNKCEHTVRELKSNLCTLLDIPNDGTWAVDYDKMCMVKVAFGSPSVV